MTESLYLAFFIWAVVFFGIRPAARPSRAHHASRTHRSGNAASAWPLPALPVMTDGSGCCVLAAIILASLYRARPKRRDSGLAVTAKFASALPPPRPCSGSPTTPSSIATHSSLPTARTPPRPSSRRPRSWLSPPPRHSRISPWPQLYFIKCAEINVGQNLAELSGCSRACFAHVHRALARNGASSRCSAPSVVARCRFYMLSVAYGGVPIFIPTGGRIRAYNVRYGIQMLPAFAVLLPIAAFILRRTRCRIPSFKRGLGSGRASCWCSRATSRVWHARPGLLSRSLDQLAHPLRLKRSSRPN